MGNKLDASTRDQNRNGLPQNGGSEALKDNSAQQVANALEASGNPVSESTTETFKFGLTLPEEKSIEDDIHAGKPIMATPAYIKFLSALLPNELKIEDGKKLLIFSLDTPEYEIHNGAIRANHAGAVAIIADGLSQLFGRQVRLPTVLEVQEKIAEHKHFAGCRGAGSGKSGDVGDFGCGWVGGVAGRVGAPYAGLDRNGNTESDLSHRRSGLSLFPYFG